MSRLAEFNVHLERARQLIGLGDAITGLSSGRLDSTDLYRSALVQGVAALDTYVHGVVLDRAVDILLGRSPTGSVSKIGFHFGIVSDLLSATSPVERELRARSHVAARLAKETFQRPDAIAQAFAMVGIPKVWATTFGSAAEATMLQVSLIVRRRNDIVHSCDVDAGNPGQYKAMSANDASGALLDLARTVQGIDPFV